jgi:hypothetical protein
MTKDEALKLAIGKIKSARDCHFAAIDPLLFEAEEILEQALAAPTVQEPVAWMHEWDDGERIPLLYGRDERNTDQPKSVRPLVYGDTTPPEQRQWVGLTDEEREQHRDDWRSNIHDKEFRAIEAKLKEKNT